VDWVLEPWSIELVEFEVEPGVLPTEVVSDLIRLDRVAFGRLDADRSAYDVRLVVKNANSQAIRLTLEQGFFALEDRQGRAANLIYFCCATSGEILVPGQEREVQLIFEDRPEWGGKGGEGVAYLRVRGFLPIVRASWTIPLPVTAD
jgi:hypothetical protein